MIALMLAAALMAVARDAETQDMRRARGTFDVTVTPVGPEPGAEPDAPSRMLIAKVYHGDIEGTGVGQMLATMGPERSGAYVALERVAGTLDGKAGTFAIVHRGLMDRGAQDLSITVAPGSGTGELVGITGIYILTIEGDEHRYDLEYDLPKP